MLVLLASAWWWPALGSPKPFLGRRDHHPRPRRQPSDRGATARPSSPFILSPACRETKGKSLEQLERDREKKGNHPCSSIAAVFSSTNLNLCSPPTLPAPRGARAGLSRPPWRPGFQRPKDPEGLALAHRKLGAIRGGRPPPRRASTTASDRTSPRPLPSMTSPSPSRWGLVEADRAQAAANLKVVTEGLALAEDVCARCCVDIAGSFNKEWWSGPHPQNFSPSSSPGREKRAEDHRRGEAPPGQVLLSNDALGLSRHLPLPTAHGPSGLVGRLPGGPPTVYLLNCPIVCTTTRRCLTRASSLGRGSPSPAHRLAGSQTAGAGSDLGEGVLGSSNASSRPAARPPTCVL